MTILGAHGTGNITANERVIDVPKKIFFLQPDAAPLLQILTSVKEMTAINPKFTWFERDLFPRRDQAAETKASSATTLTVDNGDYFKAYDVVKNEATGEVMLVTSVASDVLTLSRGWGTTSADTITDNNYLLILGNANEEGASSPSVKSETNTECYNYVQDIRTPFETTDMLEASELHTGNDLTNERKIKMIEHKVDIERAFLFGERKVDTATGTHPIYATGGALSFISTNVTNVSTTLTNSGFETILESAFQYGSKTKLLLCSAKILSGINSWGRAALQTVPKDKTYGIDIKEYLSAHGRLLIAKHELFTGSTYGGLGLILDPSNVKIRRMNKIGKTVLRTNLQGNSETKFKEEYRSVVGLQVNNEATHAYFDGVTAYAA